MNDRRCDPLALALADALDRERRLQAKTYKAMHMSPTTLSAALDGHTSRTSTFDRMAAALNKRILVTLVARG